MKKTAFLWFCAAIMLPVLRVPASGGPVEAWQEYETSVRDAGISKAEASRKLESVVSALSADLLSKYTFSASSRAFPVEGHGLRALNKAAFAPHIVYGPYGTRGYEFFDGNRHGGHPAYDIFIRDRDMDSLDDRSGKPVNAAALADSVAVSINTGWQKGGKLRGGNYAWLYSPVTNRFFYYAHLGEVFVKPGEFIPAGGKIGTIGRTGRLADSKSSPTHVHFMVLDYQNGKLIPYDYYNDLKNLESLNAQ